jgi:hypothetical protein
MAGLTWQLYLVCKIYFSYKVTTSLRIEFPPTVSPQATSFCARNTDILQFDRLNAKTGKNWSYTMDLDTIRKYQEELTVNQFFEFTPPVDEVIQRILYRAKGTYERFVKAGREVYDTFTVTKYAYLEYVCYRMWDKTAADMTFRELAVTPTSAGMIYELYLNETMIRSNYIRISLHGRDKYPYRSLKISPVTRRGYNEETKTSRYNMYVNQQIRLTVKLLPPPFESNCMDYKKIGIDSDVHCIQDCIRRQTKEKYDMIPFGVIVNGTLQGEEKDMKMISYNNVASEVFGRELLEMAQRCGDVECNRLDCDLRTAMTITTLLYESDVSVIGMRFNVPSDPYIWVMTSPALNVVEFLTYIMSCVSTWTGLSIMSTEPLRLVRLSRRKYAEFTGRRRASSAHDQVSFRRGLQSRGVTSSRGVEEVELRSFDAGSRSDMRKRMLTNISMMHHIASLSHRIKVLEEFHSSSYATPPSSYSFMR